MSIYPHTCTAWVRGADDNRKATWAREVLTRIRIEEAYGASPGTQGDVSQQSAVILMPGSSDPLKKGDKVMMGTHEDGSPPQDAFTVETVVPVHINQAVHHWELTAR